MENTEFRNKVREIVNEADKELEKQFKDVDAICEFNSEKI